MFKDIYNKNGDYIATCKTNSEVLHIMDLESLDEVVIEDIIGGSRALKMSLTKSFLKDILTKGVD